LRSEPEIYAEKINRWNHKFSDRLAKPYSIGMKDDSPFVFAGLWEVWKEPATEEWLQTCTIITGEPNELVAQIHTRMPVILAEVRLTATALPPVLVIAATTESAPALLEA
jgi:putative SOS response-associated peptidase YedK